MGKGPNGRFAKGEHWRPHQVFREKGYLEREYAEKQRSASEIAADHGVTESAIFFWLKKHKIPRRTIAHARLIKYWGSSGADNPMFGKRGEKASNWKGGITPERQHFYSSHEWLQAVESVFQRDEGQCRRCSAQPRGQRAFCVHHVVPFRVKHLRADPSNLVLLCRTCHSFVHSNKNVNREFLAKGR